MVADEWYMTKCWQKCQALPELGTGSLCSNCCPLRFPGERSKLWHILQSLGNGKSAAP